MTRDKLDIPDAGYVFDIDLTSGGFAYFTTFTGWVGTGRNGREKRRPCTIKTETMARALDDLGQYFYIVKDDSGFRYWLSKRGWAIVYKDYCEQKMESWLKPKYCLKNPCATFSDVSISSCLSKGRQTTNLRQRILERDGRSCLYCGKSEKKGEELTIHHIRPFSKGGETALRNLIILCKRCNQNIADDFVESLYDLIGEFYGYDLGLLNGKLDSNTWQWLVRLSDNFMHTRCELI